MNRGNRMLLSGNEAIAMACADAGVALGTGYPGTPSTEILETFSRLGGKAQWAPNEKVALEVGIGAAFSGARAIVTMKHVGVNVAADPLFTAAYTGVAGALVLISADDPGMASSQNEQDNRRYAEAAGIPMLEPSDSQEAYSLCMQAFDLSQKWGTVVMLRVTTRICHSKTVVTPVTNPRQPDEPVPFTRNTKERVMIPAYARPAHRRLRKRLDEIAAWNETEGPNKLVQGSRALGIIATGISYAHAREAAPDASVLKLGMTYPLPLDAINAFAESVHRCVVLEEGDPWLTESILATGTHVEGKPEMFRFGELNVDRVRRILERDVTPEQAPPPGKPPQLCKGCPHRSVFSVLRDLDCIVSGDIGCYTLGVLPPFQAIDTCVCMGASIGVALGLRHTLPEPDAKRVVSVIGDSTFMHSGLTGLTEMVYNPPATGHLVCILDNSTTAMTGLQENPGTGRALDHTPAPQIVFEDVVRAMGIRNVHVMDPAKEADEFRSLVEESLANGELNVIIARRPCILAAAQMRKLEKEMENRENDEQ